ncbi:hypothetical protein ACLB2K_049999 [Fragaria x ananassa]
MFLKQLWKTLVVYVYFLTKLPYLISQLFTLSLSSNRHQHHECSSATTEITPPPPLLPENHSAVTSDAAGGSQIVSQPQQSGSPSNATVPPGLVWRGITLPTSVSGTLGLISGAFGLGMWTGGGVLWAKLGAWWRGIGEDDNNDGMPRTLVSMSTRMEYSVEIYEWHGKSWEPYVADDVQVQFYMMSPYGHYFTAFKVPDIYGVCQFMVEYNRLGYTSVALSKQVVDGYGVSKEVVLRQRQIDGVLLLVIGIVSEPHVSNFRKLTMSMIFIVL